MAITTNAQGLLIQALVLDFAGVGLLGTVDAVSRVETRTQQFLLALTVASVHRGNHIIEVDRLFLLLAFHLVKNRLFVLVLLCQIIDAIVINSFRHQEKSGRMPSWRPP